MHLQQHLIGHLGGERLVGIGLFEQMKQCRVLEIVLLEDEGLPDMVMARFQRFLEAKARASIARYCGWLGSITCCSTRLMRLLHPRWSGYDLTSEPANRMLVFKVLEQVCYTHTEVSSREQEGSRPEISEVVH